MMRLFLLVINSLFLLACNESNPEEKKEQVPAALPPQYYYYPKANVYFDSANKEYLFQSGDGVTWQTAKQIPAVVQELMDKSVLIQNPSDTVWKDNEHHKLVYSALLYATPSDTVAKKKPPKRVSKPKPADDSSIEKKERKGLGKFLDKIFGRNKKEKKEKEESQ